MTPHFDLVVVDTVTGERNVVRLSAVFQAHNHYCRRGMRDVWRYRMRPFHHVTLTTKHFIALLPVFTFIIHIIIFHDCQAIL